MFLQTVLLTAFCIGLPAIAVDISYGLNDCASPVVACANQPVNQCCRNPDPDTYYDVRFTDYPSTPLFIAQAYGGENANGCDVNCNSAPGTASSICLNCADGVDVLGGANWILINGKEKRNDALSDECREVNRAYIGGHTFEVDYDRAKSEAEALVQLAIKRAAYEDVPDALLKFEL